MRRFPSLSHVHQWLARRRFAALAVAGLLWLGMVWLGSRATLDTSSLTFFPDNDPRMARMAEAMDMAPFSRLVLVDFAAAAPGQEERLAAAARAVYAALPQGLAVAQTGLDAENASKALHLLDFVPALTDEATLAALEAAVQPQAVDKAVGQARAALSGLAGLGGGTAVDWLRQDPLQFRRHSMQRLPQPPQADMLDPVLGFPRSADGRHILLVLRPAASLHDVDAALRLMDALDAALKAHVPPDITPTVVGGHRHSAANARTINNDIQRIVFWSMAGFVLVYALLVRSVTGAFWLLLTPLAAASGALGTLSLCWPVISGLALGFGASVLGIAEDYAVHMHFALRSARAQWKGDAHGSRTGMVCAVLDMLALPLFQGFVLNISGFVVLLFSGIPALRQLAAFALLTLSVGLVLALVVLPLCPGFDRPPLALPRRAALPRLPRPRPTALAVLVLLGLCVGLWPHVPADISPRGLGADVQNLQKDAEYLRAVWGGDADELWVVQGASRDEAVDAARQAAARLRAGGREVASLSDFWPTQAVMQDNVRRFAAFVQAHPELPQVLAQAAQKHGFGAEAFEPFNQWFKGNQGVIDEALLQAAGLDALSHSFVEFRQQPSPRVRVLIVARSHRAQPGEPVQESQSDPAAPAASPSRLAPMQDSLDGLSPAVRAKVTALSPAALESALKIYWRQEQGLLPVAGLLCAVLLFVCFRRVPPTLLASLPALSALAAILGWLACTQTPLTLAGMATLPLVLGLALDHGVVVTHDLALGKHLGVDRAVVTSSLTALTGMGLLALAEHPALRSMGQIIFPGLVMEMLVALWILPRLCAPPSDGQIGGQVGGQVAGQGDGQVAGQFAGQGDTQNDRQRNEGEQL